MALHHGEELSTVPKEYGQMALERLASGLAIDLLMRGDVARVAGRARAIFLYQRHGVALDKAILHTSEELGLSINVRKAANNIASASKAFILFIRHLLTPANAPAVDSQWPAFAYDERFTDGRVLYNCIRSHHETTGLLIPAEASPESLRQSVCKYTDRATRQRIANTYNKYLRSLQSAIANGMLPGLPGDFLAPLQPLGFRACQRGQLRRQSEAYFIERFPSHFHADLNAPHRFDLTKGLPGFYSKGCQPTANHLGALCLQAKRLGATALMARLHEIRAYVTRIEQRHGLLTNFADYFELSLVDEDLRARIEHFGHPSISVRTEYMHHIMVAMTYCQIDVGPIVNRVHREVRFESSKESVRGERALERGGVREMLALADGLGIYADAARKLSDKGTGDKRGAGHYLVRKSAQVDYLIRMDTGLRPGVVDQLEVADDRGSAGCRPVVWRDEGGLFHLHVPWIWMKQHKAELTGTAATFERVTTRDGKKRFMKGFSFVLRTEVGSAINDYIEHGWRYARAVQSKETRRLLLNSEGRSIVKDERSVGRGSTLILGCVREAIEYVRRTEGRELPYFDRYAHRHVIGHYVDLHFPGHQLKTTYLTHTAQKGADWYYGTTDNSLLQECLCELFAGLPSRPEQRRQKEVAQEARMQELQRQLNEVTELLRRQQDMQSHA